MMIPIRVTPNEKLFCPKASFHDDSADGGDHDNQHDVTHLVISSYQYPSCEQHGVTKTHLLISKDARLPVQLQRAMAAEAEAAREARAKVMMVMILDLVMVVLTLFLVMMIGA